MDVHMWRGICNVNEGEVRKMCMRVRRGSKEDVYMC